MTATQVEQFIAIMQSAGARWDETPGNENGVPTREITIRNGSQETWFTFNTETGECMGIYVTSYHYSD